MKAKSRGSRLMAILCAATGLTLSGGVPEARAQEVIRARDYSGFLKGDGYGWHGYTLTNLPLLEITPSSAGVMLSWSRTGMLQSASSVLGPWTDLEEVLSPCIFTPTNSQAFYRLRSPAGYHFGVGSGCPQQGFNFTGLPSAGHTNTHWANSPATTHTCGWIVPQELTGFANQPDVPPYAPIDFVRIVQRSFHINPPPPNNYTWWLGPYDSMEDDALHQNDGWFHFRVRHPYPDTPPATYRLRFELDFDNLYAFPGEPLQLNYWWVENTWDWESHDGRRIYTPMYRIKDLAGVASPWQHIAETNVFPTEGCTNAGRHYRCVFEQTLPATAWREVEVAQNLPYTLEDRERFLACITTNYLPRHPNLCIRKRHLGYGGLHYATNRPAAEIEHHELYAIEIFRGNPLIDPCAPDLPNNKIVIVLAGMDYEPAGNWVAEGVALEILDHWNTKPMLYANQASYVILPIGNPDGYEWGTVHVVPFGNGYGGTTNVIHRAHIFLEPESAVPDSALDPEALALRNYLRALTVQGLDGQGGQIVALLDFQNDLCPHPNRWQQQGGFFPPIWGLIFHRDTGASNAAVRLLANLRHESAHPYTGRYIREPDSPQAWLKVPRDVYNIPFTLLFEFDAAALYAETNAAPSWMVGEFTNPITLPGSDGVSAFYVHGYVDQVGQATAGDPAHVFKLFGRDIADAVRTELLAIGPTPAPAVSSPASKARQPSESRMPRAED